MTTQRSMFEAMLAVTLARQTELFERGGQVTNLSCAECGDAMERTPSGFICCPRGCGKLFEAANDPGRWDFTEDDETDLF